MKSMQSKLSIGLLLSLIITFSALWLLVSINIQYLAEDYIASRLKHDSENLLNSISFDKTGKLSIDTSRIDLIYNQPFSGHYYEIKSDNQIFRSRSLWDKKLNYERVITGQIIRKLQAGPDQQSLLVISSGYNKHGQPLSIIIAEDLNPIKSDINKFKYGFAALAASMLLILVILQRIILQKSLTPLIKIQSELKSLQQGQLEKLNTDVPDELRPLITEINHLLETMQLRLQRSRNALSDLAHAIKKPLTIIRQITDADSFSAADKNILIEQSEGIYQISERILKRAQLAGPGHSGALFSFKHDLPALMKTLEMMYTRKTISLNINIDHDISCPIDREDMLELLGNLLENAYKWAENKITFNAQINDERIYICIEDDGPGAAAEKIDSVSIRGVRLDEKTQGHGFGLAIASDIITDYGGEISFQHSKNLGGFKVEISLPVNR